MQERSDDELRALIDEIRDEIREAGEPEEPSEDELHHSDRERRREIARDRLKREHERIQDAMDKALPEVFAAPERPCSERWDAPLRRPAHGRNRPPPGQDRRDEDRRRQDPRRTAGGGPQRPDRTRRPRRHRQRLPGPPRRPVDGPDLPLPGPLGGHHHPRHVIRVRAGLPDHRRAAAEPAALHADARPTQPTSRTARTTNSGSTTCATTWSPSWSSEFSAGATSPSSTKWTTSSSTKPGRRSSSAARPRSPRQVLPVRPPCAAPGGPAGGRRRRRRLLRRPQGEGRFSDRGRRRQDGALLGVKNLYDDDPTLARYFESALKAHALYKRDRDYIVKDGEIVIVDEFTGRQMPGRRWSEGLHQAIEAKEGLHVQRESVTLATITFQNYFRLYTKLAGMTGTAMTEAEELHKIYKLEVVAIPTHRPMIRDDEPDSSSATRTASSWPSSTRSWRCTSRAGRSWSARLGREVRAAGRHAQAPRHQARGPQRQVPREGSSDRGPGRPQRGRHHRHEHGRPRHRHQARRQPRRTGLGDPPPPGPQPGRGGQGRLRRGVRRGQGHLRRRARDRSSPRAVCTSSAPNATTRAASTTSSAAAPAARATPARRASTSRSKTT
jgi:hypothetical protein